MQWKSPSPKAQSWLVAPIALPVVAAALIAALLTAPLWFPLHLYAKWQAARGWYRWFAWRPVYVDGFLNWQPSRWVWLETVERASPYWGPHHYRWPARAMETRQGGDATQVKSDD